MAYILGLEFIRDWTFFYTKLLWKGIWLLLYVLKLGFFVNNEALNDVTINIMGGDCQH